MHHDHDDIVQNPFGGKGPNHSRDYSRWGNIGSSQNYGNAGGGGPVAELEAVLAGYEGPAEGHEEPDTKFAEEIIRLFSLEMTTLSALDPHGYVSVVCRIWEMEDQGLLLQSNLINELGIRSMLGAACEMSCQVLACQTLRRWLAGGSLENKQLIVEAVLDAMIYNRQRGGEQGSWSIRLWEEAILSEAVSSNIAKSVVRSVIVRFCVTDCVASDPCHINAAMECIGVLVRRSSLSLPSSSSDRPPPSGSRWEHTVLDAIRTAIVQRCFRDPSLSYDDTLAAGFMCMFMKTAKLDSRGADAYVNDIIGLLKQDVTVPCTAQDRYFRVIDRLKKRMKKNIYKDAFAYAFDTDWQESILEPLES
ncbi:hypothetical protein CBR_g52745 [Chara braunii]|uniref:Uncharacterized protein n=1 Tax=Chara braunii TaxID=69332 RepID=A0A388MAT1_CHABU|nr:hypothetical protein CBR_g52745 [Chara braunii]|eukprot:GBG91666.1 hypothetical protein CBR_g52745 [Chara braunii]